MKLKYYLRGAGIGIVVTTLIFVIALTFYRPTMSDEEVKRKAAQLGMVMEEQDSENQDTQPDANEDTNQDANQDTNQDTAQPANQPEAVTFEVSSRASSNEIVSQLFQAGLIDDETAFNRYIEDKGYDSMLQPGSCQLHAGMTYEEISQVLITKQEFR